MGSFLHGVETVDIKSGIRPVREVRSGIIGIVGTAPTGDVNKLVLCLNDQDDAQFGQVTASDKHTLPSALKTLRENGAGVVVVINVGTDITKVNTAEVIGGVDADGKRTGIALLEECYGSYGFDARILIAPHFSSHPAVAAALVSKADSVKAMAYVDLPLGLKPSEAIASRGNVQPLGLNIFKTQSPRVRLCYPHRKVFDAVTNETKLEPLSIAMAGVRARIDREVGWWTSSSNKALRGTLGLERTLTARVDDPNSEVNLLNAAGFTTIFNDYGTGYNSWGNRSAAYPTLTAYENFEQVQRTKDMVEDSLHQSSLQFVDRDIKQGEIDSLAEFGNQYMRVLIQRGAIVGGVCWFDPSRNPPTQLAAGHIRISYKFTPIFPMERITYEREVTGEFLLNLKSTVGG